MAYINKDLSNARYQSFEPIPKGQYLAQIVHTEEKRSQKGDLYLSITWEILEGECRGRKVFDSLMLTGSEKAVEIGDGKLRGMAEATGHPSPNFIDNTEELHGKPCLIRVKVEEGKDGYDDQNRVTSFAKWGEKPAHPTPPRPSHSAPAVTPSGAHPQYPPQAPPQYSSPPQAPAASPAPPLAPPQAPPQTPPAAPPAPAQTAPAGPQNTPWDEASF